MRTLVNKHMMPPGGWTFVDPDTSYRTTAAHLEQLIKLCIQHRKGNDLEIPDNFAAEIEDFICAHNEPAWSTGESKRKFHLPLTETRIRNASQSQLIQWRRSKLPLVEQNIADRRAAVCTNCEYNVRSGVCFSCVGLDVMIDGYFKKTTAAGPALKICRLTAVPNGTQVHLPADALAEQEAEMPEHCWYHQILQGRS